MDNLSSYEQEFMRILTAVGCMTMQQAQYILKVYFKMSDKQIHVVLNHLKRQYMLDTAENEKYIVSGSKALDNKHKLSWLSISGLQVALDFLKEKEEPYESVFEIYEGKDNTGIRTINFVTSNGNLYKVFDLKEESIFKLKAMEKRIMTDLNIVNDDKYMKNKFEYICIFAIRCEPTSFKGADEVKMKKIKQEYQEKMEGILDQIAELDLSIPHMLSIYSMSNTTGKITNTFYGEE